MRSVRSSNSSPSKASSRRSLPASNGAAQSLNSNKNSLNQPRVIMDEKPKSMIKKIKYTGPRNDPLDPEEENELMAAAERDQVKIDLFWVKTINHLSYLSLAYLFTYLLGKGQGSSKLFT